MPSCSESSNLLPILYVFSYAFFYSSTFLVLCYIQQKEFTALWSGFFYNIFSFQFVSHLNCHSSGLLCSCVCVCLRVGVCTRTRRSECVNDCGWLSAFVCAIYLMCFSTFCSQYVSLYGNIYWNALKLSKPICYIMKIYRPRLFHGLGVCAIAHFCIILAWKKSMPSK